MLSHNPNLSKRRSRIMNGIYRLLCIFALLQFAGGAAASEITVIERGTKEEAVALVKRAAEFLRVNGPEKAYAAFDDRHGAFVDRDLYILVTDSDGTTIAHGYSPKLIGKNRADEQDFDGKYLVRERIELMKTHQNFWQSYKWSDPLTHTIQSKEVYCEVVSEGVPKSVTVCGGYYVVRK
jgi:cytochrome c